MTCTHCSGCCVKNGCRNGIQKYRCKTCRKYQQHLYTYRGCQSGIGKRVVELLKEGVGIRSTARILRISIGTVLRGIRRFSKAVAPSPTTGTGRVYEVDELWTFIGKKSNEVWITYSFDRHARSVVDFKIGSRTKENLNSVVATTPGMHPSKVCTDGLIAYRYLIPSHRHRIGLPHARHVECFNLTLLTRKAILLFQKPRDA